jgi:hypothetical protein
MPGPDAAAPAEPRQAQLVAPPWLADVEQPHPGPGQPAAVYAGPDPSPVLATQGIQPRSAYSWTERAEPAEAQQTAPVSLFAAPTADTPQRPWWNTPTFVPTDQETLPPENTAFAPSAGPPPRGFEWNPPPFSGGSYWNPPPFSGGSYAGETPLPFANNPQFARLNLPASLSPKPVHFTGPGHVEIIGGDPAV